MHHLAHFSHAQPHLARSLSTRPHHAGRKARHAAAAADAPRAPVFAARNEAVAKKENEEKERENLADSSSFAYRVALVATGIITLFAIDDITSLSQNTRSLATKWSAPATANEADAVTDELVLEVLRAELNGDASVNKRLSANVDATRLVQLARKLIPSAPAADSHNYAPLLVLDATRFAVDELALRRACRLAARAFGAEQATSVGGVLYAPVALPTHADLCGDAHAESDPLSRDAATLPSARALALQSVTGALDLQYVVYSSLLE